MIKTGCTLTLKDAIKEEIIEVPQRADMKSAYFVSEVATPAVKSDPDSSSKTNNINARFDTYNSVMSS